MEAETVTVEMSGFAAEQMLELVRARQKEVRDEHHLDCAICEAERESIKALEVALQSGEGS